MVRGRIAMFTSASGP